MSNKTGKGTGFGRKNKIGDFNEGKNHILAISVDDYSDDTYPNLKNPQRDLRAITNILKDKYCFEEKNIKILSNKDANKTNIIQELDEFSKKLSGNDNLIIFFSGHGGRNETRQSGYWITHETTHDVNHTNALYNNFVFDYIKNIDAKHILLIIDSCFSGTFLNVGTREIINDEVNDDAYKSPSRWVLTSGQQGLVLDGKNNSPFAEAIIQVLKNNNKKGVRFRTLSNEVLPITKQKVKDLSQGELKQTPDWSRLMINRDEYLGEFVFYLKKPEIDFWGEVEKENLISSYERYLRLFPLGTYKEKAKTNKADLEEDGMFKRVKGKSKEYAQRKKYSMAIEALTPYNEKYHDGKYEEEITEIRNDIFDDGAWADAEIKNTVIDYRVYENKPFAKKYIKKAKEKKKSLEDNKLWEDTDREGEEKSYIKYIEANPDGAKVEEALYKIIEMGSNSNERFAHFIQYANQYLNNSEYSKYKKEVEKHRRKFKEEEEWVAAEDLNTIDAYDEYINKYPDGLYNDNAEKLIEEIKDLNSWKKAEGDNKVEKYVRYLKEYPDGGHEKKANLKIKQLDELAWKESLKSSIDVFSMYKIKFEKGIFKKESEEWINALSKGNRNFLSYEKLENEKLYKEELKNKLDAKFERLREEYKKELKNKFDVQLEHSKTEYGKELKNKLDAQLERSKEEYEKELKNKLDTQLKSSKEEYEKQLKNNIDAELKKSEKELNLWRGILGFLVILSVMIIFNLWEKKPEVQPLANIPKNNQSFPPYVTKENFGGNLFKAQLKSDKTWVLINKNDSTINNLNFLEIQELKNGLAIVQSGTEKWGFANSTGAIVGNLDLDSIGDFSGNLAFGFKDGNIIGINEKGQKVLEKENDTYSFVTSDNLIIKLMRMRDNKIWYAEDAQHALSSKREPMLKYFYSQSNFDEICMNGWHGATKDEWKNMLRTYDGYVTMDANGRSTPVGRPSSTYKALLNLGFISLNGRINNLQDMQNAGDVDRMSEYWTNTPSSEDGTTAFWTLRFHGKPYFIPTIEDGRRRACRCVKD